MCTGLVVNDRPNVPSGYTQEIRALLHMWRKYGLVDAGTRFFSQLDKRNRVSAKKPDDLRLVVRGKIQFVGWIKGWDNPVYVRLASTLVGLDKTFRPKTPLPIVAKGRVRVFAEGKTDYQHLQSALTYYQAKGQYTDLSLDLALPVPFFQGESELLQRCKIFAAIRQAYPVICTFDRDVPGTTAAVSDGATPYRSWGNRVYSLAIPIPSHRAGASGVCIEMYYKGSDLLLTDRDRRRLFLRQEFNDKGFDVVGKLKMENPKSNKLVVEETVFDLATQESVGLSKAAFAQYIVDKVPPFDGVDFEAFPQIFDMFRAILRIDSGTP